MYLKIDGVPICESDVVDRLFDAGRDMDTIIRVGRAASRCAYSIPSEAEAAKKILEEFANVLGIGEVSLVDGMCPNYNKQGEKA